MTINEMLKTLREGNAVTCDDRLYMKIENGRFVERIQESGEIVRASSCVLISIDDVLRNETNYRIYKNPILNDKEKEYLRAVIKPFRDRVCYIQKVETTNSDNQFIFIKVKRYDCEEDKPESTKYEDIDLPYFKANTMYKNMKGNKKYSLEELGL